MDLMQDLPVDLSTKHRNVSVQTEKSKDRDRLKDYLLEVTLGLLSKKDNLEKFNENIINLITYIRKSEVTY